MESAARCGFGRVETVFEELRADAEAAINIMNRDLPSGFPEQVTASIGSGLRARLRSLEFAASNLGQPTENCIAVAHISRRCAENA